ncbi:MAG: SpoIIE family protein phosphatase [Planctomycetes bacterium]|nr:SpoIIE family protein phosphatase [Planctomycetota bacterium]
MSAVVEIRFEEEARVLVLTDAVVTIGRSVDNVLEIPDPNMSRRHCVIEQRETGEVILTDCNSSNGTRVNDQPVLSQELTSGDTISCGSTTILFARSEEELVRVRNIQASDPGPPGPTFQEENTVTQSSRLRQAKRGPAKTQAAVLAHERDDLRKLLEITKQLNQVHDLRVLLEKIIDAAIELLAAERGFLILLNDGEMKIEIARTSRATTVPDAATQVSTQICREVIETVQPVLTTNAQTDDRFGRYKSVVGLQLRSILCIPFVIKEEVFGTVYLDAGDVGAFGDRDVELLSAFGDQAALAINNARLLSAARRRSRIEQELRIASQIQAKLLPRTFPDIAGLRVYGSTHPAKEVGGDYFDFVTRRDGQLWFCIGDVTGKGVPAGMVMTSARSVLRSLVERVEDTRELVVALNTFLCTDLEDEEIFLSFVLMRYSPETGRIFYTGAGHENILIWRGAEERVETQKTGGMVLGLTSRLEDQYQERELFLSVGDALLLYTDGVTEAMDGNREQFGMERLVASAERHLRQPPEVAAHSVLGDVLRFQKGAQRDDVTLVLVSREHGENDPPEGSEETRPGGVSRRDVEA